MPLPAKSHARMKFDAGRGSEYQAKVKPMMCFTCPLEDKREHPSDQSRLPWNKLSLDPPGPDDLSIKLFDCATTAVHTADVLPGLDAFHWRELRMEERWQGTLSARTNAGILLNTPLMVQPWPLALPRHAPIDWAQHYDGLDVQLWVKNPVAWDSWGKVPFGRFYVLVDPYSPLTSIAASAAGRTQTPDELREASKIAEQPPAPWIRLPFGNEMGFGEMKSQAIAVFRGIVGADLALSVANGPLFVPFDLRYPERYTFLTSEGDTIEHGEAYRRISSNDQVNLYLRARTWRYYASVLVHYAYVTIVTEEPVDEWFLGIFYDRPPFYPYRQDIAHELPDEWDSWNKAWVAYDIGVDRKWQSSLAAQDMAFQIFQQQWYSLCAAYLYTGNEPACITVWECPPAVGEIVAGLGLVSRSTGQEHLVWVQQKEDATAVYPQMLLGQFYGDFNPTGLGFGGSYSYGETF